jgi:hypothetical protein
MANHPETVSWDRYRRELDEAQRCLALAKAEAALWQELTWRKIVDLGAHFGTVTVRSGERDVEVSAVVGLIQAMWTLVESDAALRGLPSEDTMRVGHGTMVIDGESVAVTGVERHVLNGGRARWLRRKVTRELEGLTSLIYNELEGRRPDPIVARGRRCRNAVCDEYNRAWQKTPHCGWCTEPLEEAA